MKPSKLKHIFIHKRLISKWQTYLFGSLMFTVGIIFSIALLSGYIKLPKIFATTSWTQTDWSGGVGSSTSNQYVSGSNIDATTTPGQIGLLQGAEQILNSGFETNLTSWSAGLSPDSISGLQVWLKADAITGKNNNDSITTWSDSSGNSRDVTAASGKEPIYNTGVLNGNPVVSFVAANQDTLSNNYNVSTPYTAIYVARYNGATKARIYSSKNNNWLLGFWSGRRQVFYADGTLDLGGQAGDTSWYLYTGAGTGSLSTAYENGTQWVSGSGGISGPNGISLGSYGGGSSEFSDAQVAEFIIYNSVISSTNRQLIEGYLANKYGLTSTSYLTSTNNTDTKRSGTASVRLIGSTSGGNFTQTINVGDTSAYSFSTYAYTTGATVTSSDVELFHNGATISTTYTSAGGGWYKLSAIVAGENTSRQYGVQVKANKTIYIDDFSLTKYSTTATLTSNIFDASTGHDWGIVSYTTTTPATTSISVKVRSSNNSDMSGATDWASCTGIASGALASTGGCVTNNHRYVQYQVTLSGDGSATPTFSDITINMTPSDTSPPTSNASFPVLKTSPTGTTITESTYTGVATPYLSFTAGADNGGGSGLKGYCIYLGTDPLLDPGTTKGSLLGTSPVSTTGSTCQFIIPGTTLDLSTSGYMSSTLTSSLLPYYLLIKAIDNGNNIYQGAATSFAFLYDGTAPTNVAYLSTPSTIYSNVNEMVFSWPTTGASSATDTHSQVLGYQYQINNSSGTWKGTTHSDACDLDYIPVAEGSHTLTALSDGSDIVIGNNVVYLRTIDNVCNPSTSATYRTGNLEYGGEAPSFAISCSSTTGVVVTPLTNTDNSYSFAWDEATPSNTNTITNYYYMINTQPPGALSTITSNNSTYIDVRTNTSVTTRSFSGLVKGTNTVYVVARDSADNYSSSTCVKGTFVLNSDYPDPPKNVTVSDASIKTSSLWRASLAWSVPDYTGTGMLTYTVSRSEDSSTWTEITTTTGTAYVDTVPTSTRYYFKVCSHDTSSESIQTPSCANTITIIPKGSFTSAPDLASGPTVSSITTKKATIKWTTSRNSDSKVSYGTGSNSYYSEEPSNSSQVTDHTINLTNLSPGTTYFYKTKWTDEDGNTGISEEKSFKTEDAPTVVDPRVLSAGLDIVTLSFTSKGSSKVKVYYGTTTSFGGTKEFSTSTSETVYTTTVEGLQDGTKYFYKINSFDSEGSEYEGNTLTFETLPRPKITNVRFQEVTGTAQPAIIVSWDTNTETSSIITYYPQGRPQLSQDEISVSLVKGPHKMLIKNLNPQTIYEGQVKGKDKAGNEATSDTQSFTTSTDTRPPQVMNLRIEGSSDIQGSSSSGSVEDAKSQLVVSWDTDEPATSQVEFGEGTGTNYNQKTQEDTNLTTNHVIIISNLTPSKVYHLRTLSKDKAQNTGQSVDTVTITPKSTRSALELVIGNLYDVFGIFSQ
jgi:hypothetical protein